jgi:hypothetical protein
LLDPSNAKQKATPIDTIHRFPEGLAKDAKVSNVVKLIDGDFCPLILKKQSEQPFSDIDTAG